MVFVRFDKAKGRVESPPTDVNTLGMPTGNVWCARERRLSLLLYVHLTYDLWLLQSRENILPLVAQ